jgi:hypothetical protein
VIKLYSKLACFFFRVVKSLITKNISSGAQYVTLQKYFSHPSLVKHSFTTPPVKLKPGQQIGEGLLIANHLDQSL